MSPFRGIQVQNLCTVANELSALVEVAGDSVDRLVLTPAESLHRAIAGRIFRSIGPISAPSRFIHDGIAYAGYAALRNATGSAAAATAAAVRLTTGDDVRLLSRSRRGRAAVSALNALLGDVLEERGNALAIPMAIRRSGTDLPCDPEHLRRAFRNPTARLAVFLHGLGETDENWLRGRAGHPSGDRQPFGMRLRRDFGITPIYIRYNTGLHISENGGHLSDLLERLLDAWPLAVEELILIGHSMGGLVARSACHVGSVARRRWPSRAHHLITLGAPHTGVPLEKLVHATAWLLRAVPESRPLAEILDLRSGGIRDLRFGYLVEEDWRGEDPRRLLDDRRSDVPPLAGCTHTFITGTLTRDPRHPLSWIGGDLLVRTESAAGRRGDGSVAVSADSVVHVGALTHFDLLDHPLVYEHIRRALAARQRGSAARGGDVQRRRSSGTSSERLMALETRVRGA